jgi:hypothetical protein
MCYDCKYSYENENPNLLNYYFNKITTLNQTSVLKLEEHEYLYYNREITLEIAVSQISNTIHNVHSFMICPICKISIYKTEKCNGISHHGLERCYACGRVGFKIKGLGSHWQPTGKGGCFRFDHDDFVKKYIPSYSCTEYSCGNHDRGDCSIPNHQNGIHALNKIRKKSYVYHLFKSLNPNLRYEVFDCLFAQYSSIPTFVEYLPYKQSLVLLETYKTHLRHFSEDILYDELHCSHPQTLFQNKSIFYSSTTFMNMYTITTTLIPYTESELPPQILSPLPDILRFYSTRSPIALLNNPLGTAQGNDSDSDVSDHTITSFDITEAI